ncbi:hypothetical protein Esi_0489_0025 [Ectocarpus siliculosus]|uniref:Uncharacterized protein n=1 Tax=Ectocarpus siliculosus TaxID=2880 RepID=D7G2V3_ECTSI|nr:hypothetical protein Esi_0489_0025 [Ectocarpus siliculosus]|eukprot:CBJ33457.1 hypothetical protein Esi_0489_0025 [Ectocarpus siliculosus]
MAEGTSMAIFSNPRTTLREPKRKRDTGLDIFGLGSEDDVDLTVTPSVGDEDSETGSGKLFLPFFAERGDGGISHNSVPEGRYVNCLKKRLCESIPDSTWRLTREIGMPKSTSILLPADAQQTITRQVSSAADTTS